jgi:DNA repair photolyase
MKKDEATCIDTELPKQNCKEVFGTLEWAAKNANFISGCSHDCKYCYSKEMAIRFKRKTAQNWKNEEIREESLKKKFKKIDGKYMFPSSHDIHPSHINESLFFLKKILEAGNDVLIVTKPHFECIEAICKEFTDYKENIMFRFTIGSASSKILEFWEPGAPCYEERLSCLKFSFALGFETSLSCEPMLDNNTEQLVIETLPFITDSIWVGKANFLIKRLNTNKCNSKEEIQKAEELIEWQKDENIKLLYNKFKENPQIKWKESIKKVVNIQISTTKGLDI